MILKKQTVIGFLLMFFLLKPTGLDALSVMLNQFMNIFRLISMLYVFVSYIYMISKRKINFNKFILLLFLIELIGILVCIFNHFSPYNLIVYWQSIISLLMLFECFHNQKKSFIKILRNVLEIYVFFNFFHMMLHFSDISNSAHYVLGKKNMIILYTFPLIILEYLDIILNKKTGIGNLFMLLISFITSFLIPSSTSVSVSILLLIYPLYKNNKNITIFLNKITAKKILTIMLILFVLIIVLGVQKYFSGFIINFLGKDLTFTGRTYVWESCIKYIRNNPFGYGWEKNIYDIKSILAWEVSTEVGHAHNFILNLAYKCGVVTSILYVMVLLIVSNSIDKCKHFDLKLLYKIGFISFLILTTFEAYPTNCVCIFFLCFLFAETPKIENEVI